MQTYFSGFIFTFTIFFFLKVFRSNDFRRHVIEKEVGEKIRNCFLWGWGVFFVSSDALRNPNAVVVSLGNVNTA